MMGSFWFIQMLPEKGPQISPALWDFLLVVGVLMTLAVVLFILTALFRRRKKRRHHSRRPEILRNSEELKKEASESRGEGEGRIKRRRRRRRDHTPSNPTLAEAGGLPPKRGENETPYSGI